MRKEKICKWRFGEYICTAKASSKKNFCELHNSKNFEELKNINHPCIVKISK